MVEKRIVLGLVFALLSTVLAVGVSAQVTISGGFALSSIKGITVDVNGQNAAGGIDIEPETGIGGNIYLDYLLPVGIPLSLGVEVGYDTGKFTLKAPYYEDDTIRTYNETMSVVPLLVRAAYHFDLVAKLDLYVVGKIGYALGFWSGEFYDISGITSDIGGLAFGFDVGIAYYLTPVFGFFAEAGFDDYMLETKFTERYVDVGDFNYTLEAPFNRFVTVGISTKF
jgi:opacity protein-like surface antigen